MSGIHHIERKILYPNNEFVPWDDSMRMGVISHAHSSAGGFHFHKEFTETGSLFFILVDNDDTENWPHTLAGYIHIDAMDVQIDPEVNAAFDLHVWWIENVTMTKCDKYMAWSTSGSKRSGQAKEIFQPWTPVGMKCERGRFISNMSELGSSDICTGEELSTILPGAPTAAPGEYDLILEVNSIAASFWLDVNISYHTHNPDDPEH